MSGAPTIHTPTRPSTSDRASSGRAVRRQVRRSTLGDGLGRAMVRFSSAYADQNEKDHAAFVRRLESRGPWEDPCT